MKKTHVVMAIIFALILLLPIKSYCQEAIIADHNAVIEFDLIPQEWLDAAKELTIHYAHTSHGSQVRDGALWLEEQDSSYSFAVRVSGTEGLPPIEFPAALRMYDGNPPETYITPEIYWATPTGISRTQAVANTGNYDFSMWSWCGQQSSNTVGTVQAYLDQMDAFETQYSSMRFILMTGHTDGGSATLTRNNQMVRDYANENGKILYDFADIESWDPDGNYYPNTTDACSWCDSWCRANPDKCDLRNLPSDCAHSHGYNCVVKAKAFWWMMARLAGWEPGGTVDETPPVIGDSTPDTFPAGTTQITLSVGTNENATCKYDWDGGEPYSNMEHLFSVTGDRRSHNTVISPLSNGSSYTLYVRCIDNAENANLSDHVISFSVEIPNDPPDQVQNLSVTGSAPSSCSLSWEAPADDGVSGRASFYDLRYSNLTITEGNWAQASRVSGEPVPGTPDSIQGMTVNGLAPASSYYFAIKAGDEINQLSAISLNAQCTTEDAPDLESPVISNAQPDGILPAGTASVEISLNTNELATCRLSDDIFADYDSALDFDNTSALYHSTTVNGLADGSGYTYYAFCMDSSGNANSEGVAIEFSIGSFTPESDIEEQIDDPIVEYDGAKYNVLGGCGMSLPAGAGQNKSLILLILSAILFVVIRKQN